MATVGLIRLPLKSMYYLISLFQNFLYVLMGVVTSSNFKTVVRSFVKKIGTIIQLQVVFKVYGNPKPFMLQKTLFYVIVSLF